MRHLHTVFIVSSSLTVTTKFYGVHSVVACTLVCETGSTGSIPVGHPKEQTPAFLDCAVNNLRQIYVLVAELVYALR